MRYGSLEWKWDSVSADFLKNSPGEWKVNLYRSNSAMLRALGVKMSKVGESCVALFAELLGGLVTMPIFHRNVNLNFKSLA